MTDEEKLARFEVLISPDTASTELLQNLLWQAEGIVLNRRYPFGSPEGRIPQHGSQGHQQCPPADGAADQSHDHSQNQTQTACGGGSAGKGQECRGQALGGAHHIGHGVNDDVVEEHEEGQGDEQGEASRHGGVALLGVQLLDLLGHLLLGGLVVAALVLVADGHLAGTELGLLAGVLLLVNAEGQHQKLNDNSKYNN